MQYGLLSSETHKWGKSNVLVVEMRYETTALFLSRYGDNTEQERFLMTVASGMLLY